MRILVTCDRYPSPRHEGLVLRIYHYVRHLSARHEFHLVCLERPGQIRDDELEKLFGQVVRIPFPEQKSHIGFDRWRAALDCDELYVHSDDIRRKIESVVDEGRYDLIWDAGCNMLLNLNTVRQKVPLLADQVDDSFLEIRRALGLSGGLRRSVRLYKLLFLQKKFAKQHLANAEAVLFVSPLDESSFAKVCPNSTTITIANGVDELFFQPALTESNGFKGRPEIVFEGVMCFPPNVDAAQYFTKDIFPLVRERIPDAHFSLVGRDPSPQVSSLRSNDIEVTGFVDDIRPWLENAHVFVCPMRSGAGIKNKILQAWAMGKAVVSTPEGAFGLAAENGKNILLCSSPKEFAVGVTSLIENHEQRQKLGSEARKTIEANYSWLSKSLELETLCERIVSKRSNYSPSKLDR